MRADIRRWAGGPFRGESMSIRELPFALAGLATRIGEVVSIEDWARWARIPHRKEPRALDGAEVKRVLQIDGKSWQPELFRDPAVVSALMGAAIERAGLEPGDIDAAIFVTCTPFELMLDQDPFRLLRAAGVPDDVVPWMHMAGCGGLARAAATAARLQAENVLLVAYTAVSPLMTGPGGEPNPIYQHNEVHPDRAILWASPGLFSDAAAAAVLRRSPREAGLSLYTRARLDPPVESPLVRFPGGGALHPPGFAEHTPLAAFGLVSEDVRRFYTQGMIDNHHRLLEARPDLLTSIKRLYTHQAGPALVKAFADQVQLPSELAPSNVRRLGNLVSPCTLVMLDDDLNEGRVEAGDEICVSVVGAGPERGAFVLRVTEDRPR